MAFLDFAIRVCRATRAGIIAGAVLYALFLGFMLVWRFQTGPFATAGEYLLSGRVVAMAIVTVLLGVAGWRRYRDSGSNWRVCWRCGIDSGTRPTVPTRPDIGRLG